MTRAEVAAWIGRRLADVLGKAGMTAADTEGNLKDPIDDALRAIGFEEDQLADAEPDSAIVFRAVVRYFTLSYVLDALPTQFDASLPGGLRASRSQVFKQVEQRMVHAYQEVVRVYGELDSGPQFGTWNLNYLTPSTAECAERYA